MEWDDRRALVALNALPGLGPSRIAELVAKAGSAAAVARAPERWLSCRAGRATRRGGALERLWEQEQAALERCGAHVLIRADPEYPERLEHLTHPPPVLAVRGRLELSRDAALVVTVIGARACTPYGRAQAERFGAGLAEAGAVVVSGGARGIDRAAMEGACRWSGRVAAVLGSGLAQPYPPEARGFLDEIVGAGGAVLSEFPCEMTPARGNFPRRNRLLAALAHAVLVVQATEKSGSMITIGWALHLGRDVFAVPGNVDVAASRGPHQLLRDGALLAESPGEVLAHYDRAAPRPASEEPPLLAALADGDKSLEQLGQELGHSPERVLLELVEWELRGRVTRLANGFYHRCGPGPGR